ncbi:Transposase [Desulforhopalus singaporensis]|uniref:Transposase n=1 Tax=Desulforhopalus singaporensis TaxID=91360 RepID=A0A1H0SG21_9BACT|nr:transposase [Desulforhopalus singaporensis]SDP40198.1 Transposase [Desulforhopalus singaporensis]
MSRRRTIEVILGVDTHLGEHIGVVIDSVEKYLSHLSVTTDSYGYHKLVHWAHSFGDLRRAGGKSTGTYGAGLARFLTEQGVLVLEINRPDRSMRRFRGKSDPTDAESAARTVLSGIDCSIPKLQSGPAEAMLIISVARRSTVKSRTQTINQLRGLLISAPDEIRSRLWKSNAAECAKSCLRLRSFGKTPWGKTLASTLRFLAKRWLY